MPPTKHRNKNLGAKPDFDWPTTAEAHNHYYQIKTNRTFDFGKLAFGIILIVLGLVYLAVNQGWLPDNAKPDLWQLWPILLICAGLSMLKGGGLLALLSGSLITLTTLTFCVLLIFGSPTWQQPTDLESLYRQSAPDKIISSIETIDLPLTPANNLIIKQLNGRFDLSGGDNRLGGRLESNLARLTLKQDPQSTNTWIIDATDQIKDVTTPVHNLNLTIPPINSLQLDGQKNTTVIDAAQLKTSLVINDRDSDTTLLLGRRTERPPLELKITQANSRLNLSIAADAVVRLIGATQSPAGNLNWLETKGYFTNQQGEPDYLITIESPDGQIITTNL